MKQLKTFNGIVSKTVKRVDIGSCADWGKADNLVITFSDDSYIIIIGKYNYTEYPDVAVDRTRFRPTKFLTQCGVFTQDELNNWTESEKKKEDEIVRENELKQLKKLKKKYRMGSKGWRERHRVDG